MNLDYFNSIYILFNVIFYIYIYAFSRRFYPKRLTGYTFFVSMCVPGNWTHNLCAANAMLYHWATGTPVPVQVFSNTWNATLLSVSSSFSVFGSVLSLRCPPSQSVWRICGRPASCWTSTGRRWLSLMENMMTCCRCWRSTGARRRSRWCSCSVSSSLVLYHLLYCSLCVCAA